MNMIHQKNDRSPTYIEMRQKFETRRLQAVRASLIALLVIDAVITVRKF